MALDIHERDVGEALCRACAACCRVTFRLEGTNSRYRRFLRQIGWRVLPPAREGRADCCEAKHEATVDAGPCRNLVSEDHAGAPRHRCRIHGTAEYPDLCADFNCVSWAKAHDNYSEKNHLLVAAQRALDGLRGAGDRAPPPDGSASLGPNTDA